MFASLQVSVSTWAGLRLCGGRAWSLCLTPGSCT